MSGSIHPTAVISDEAVIAPTAHIGPYTVIEGPVEVGENVLIKSHVSLAGHTRIGADCKIFPFASVGQPPQDLKYAGEPSRLEVGARTVIREHATLNPGTTSGGMLTSVGSDCLLMIGVHIAHDCQVGNKVIMANNATLAGHVVVEDEAVIGGLAAVHQFVRIGKGAMIGGMSGVEQDVLPYSLVMGERANWKGLNVVGLKRQGAAKSDIDQLKAMFNTMFAAGTPLQEIVANLQQSNADNEAAKSLLTFAAMPSKRGLCYPAA